MEISSNYIVLQGLPLYTFFNTVSTFVGPEHNVDAADGYSVDRVQLNYSGKDYKWLGWKKKIYFKNNIDSFE